MPATEPPGYAPPPNPEPLDDLEIWNRLFYSDRGDAHMRLYDGDLSISQGDHSLGVIMLANQLAWLTDFDVARMRRLLYETGLVRPKWEEKRSNMTWIEFHIEDAIAYMSGRRI